MNWDQLKTFFWLRYRLRLNQFKKAGALNAALFGVLAIGACFGSFGFAIGGFALGNQVLGDVPPPILMFVWDGLLVAFLFSWAVGLLAELQRSEVLSLNKFLHLPVSLSGAYFINYLSSFFSLTLMLFLPMMVGLALGLVSSRGVGMSVALPLLAAFLFMITAVTYQFQGWLSAIMINPRRRRTVIVCATMAVVLVAQAPQLINLMAPWRTKADKIEAHSQEKAAKLELDRRLNAGEINVEQFNAEIAAQKLARIDRKADEGNEIMQNYDRIFDIVNLAVPPLWMTLGVKHAANGVLWPALLGIVGMTAVGYVSLARGYRTILRLHTGHFTSKVKPASAATIAKRSVAPTSSMLDWDIPWIPQDAATIALGSLRSMIRAPEVKMLLLTPIFMGVAMVAIFFAKSVTIPEPARPFIAFGAMALNLLGMVQLVGNQFGFDRGGFRVFVLCAANRRDILLGKNFAAAPLALGMGLFTAIMMQIVMPMRIDRFLTIVPQFVAMYLLFCTVANFLSIYAAMPISAASLKPVKPKMGPIMLQMISVFLFPMVLSPAMIPSSVEIGLEYFDILQGWPVGLLLSLLGCALAGIVYHYVLIWQGRQLQSRELKILDVVAARAE